MKAHRDYEHRKEPESYLFKKLAVLLLALSIVFGAYYIWSRDYFSKQDNTVPILVKANNDEIKKAPINPGGMQVPNQDKAVYESFIDPKKSGTRKAEILLPNPEEPLSRKDIFGEMEETPAHKELDTIIQEQTPQVTKPEEMLQETRVSETGHDYAIPTSNDAGTKSNEQVQKHDYSLPISTQKSKATPYKIQLASVSSKQVAMTEWTRLSKKHKVLQNLKPIIDQITTEKGTIFKLSAGAVPSETDANKRCKELQSSKQFCFVQKIKP